jgi:Ni/Fe-hydrogenase subunit HybB-like protein
MQAAGFRQLDGPGRRFWWLLACLAVPLALGFASFLRMETQGHSVTGMDNQIVWGMPHVFAVFLIVSASGALNIASIASVFGRTLYKPLAPLSGLLAIALLAGGLTVLMLDLGRPERLIVAMTHFNFQSIFGWNIFLYTGFFAVVAVYLWFMLDPGLNRLVAIAGFLSFVWRLVLTTGTGSIFGFLVARQAYDSALLAPMFIAFSFAYGTALFILVLAAISRFDGLPLGGELLSRLRNLLGIFVGASLYFIAIFHLTKLYLARYAGIERFILLDGGIYPFLFWGGQVVLGGLLPLALIFHPGMARSRAALVAAAALVALGGLAQMYVTIIGAQAWPLLLFPGMLESSSFFDGEIHPYAPSVVETLLGIGGVALAATLVAIALRVLPFLPRRLAQAEAAAGQH